MPGWLVRVEAGSDRELGVEGELGGVAWQRLGRAAGRKKQGGREEGARTGFVAGVGRRCRNAGLARRGSRGIGGSTAVGGRRDVRAPGACVVERPSGRGVQQHGGGVAGRRGRSAQGEAGGGGSSGAGSTGHHGRAASRRACAASCAVLLCSALECGE